MSFTLENILLGALPNDGTGDPLRVAFAKINNNFTVLSNITPGGPVGAIQFSHTDGYSGTANLVYDSVNNVVNLSANIIPIGNSVVAFGNTTNPITSIDTSSLTLGNITMTESGNVISFPVTVDHTVSASLANIHDITINGNLTVANSKTNSFTVTTMNNNPNQVIKEIPANNIKSALVRMYSNQPGAYNSQSVILQITKRNDNASASYVAYGTEFIGLPVTTYNVDLAFGNVRIMVSPLFNDVLQHLIDITIYN